MQTILAYNRLDFVGKTIKVEDRFIKLLLWDTAG
jgi:GTPase SAR1 family protein